MNLESGSISCTRLNQTRGSGRQTLQQNDFANIVLCKKECASTGTFYETEKNKRQKEKKSCKKQVPSYTYFFKGKFILFSRPVQTRCLGGRAVRGAHCVWNKVTHLLAFCCTASIPQTRRIARCHCSLVLSTRLQPIFIL